MTWPCATSPHQGGSNVQGQHGAPLILRFISSGHPSPFAVSGYPSPIPPTMDEPSKLHPLHHRAGADDTQPVSGINIFWIVLVLGITSAWHPLGSSVGFPSKLRRYTRIFPLTALFDTVLLYGELVACMLEIDNKRSLRGSARSVSIRRLRAAVPFVEGVMGGDDADEGGNQWLKAMILFIGLDVRVRFLSNALVVFVYAKIFGYHGTPVSLSITTVQFASWAGNELFLLLTYGFSWARTTRLLVAAVDGDAATPTRPNLAFPGLIPADRLLLAGQATAFVAVGIWSIASTTHHAPPPSAGALGFWDTLGWIMDAAMGKLVASLAWCLEFPASLVEKAWSFSPVVAVILSPIFLIMFVFFLFPAALLMTIGLASLSMAVFLPIMMACTSLVVICIGCGLAYQRLSAVVWARVGSFLVLVGLLVYYLWYWDSAGTSKAPWTENLG